MLQVSFFSFLTSCTKFEFNSLRDNEIAIKLLIIDIFGESESQK